MKEDEKKPGTDGQENEPPKSPSPDEKLTWWNGEEITFVGIMDL
ncbi:MAG: hypothetical protein WC619_02190 [Patescibacteria group bacterium]